MGIIEVKDVKKIYKNGKIEVEALKGINFSVEKGEFVAIMGSSGCGKSTMMNILGCLDTLSLGKYILDGEDVSKISGKKLAFVRNKKIGFVFQSFNLLPKLSALQNVELPMVYAGISREERRKKALHSLDIVGLLGREHHKPNEMSGGQRQRVAIARSLVNDPAIILADEPTGNLDPETAWEIMELLKEINARGTTVVIATHAKDIVDEMKKRVITLQKGIILSDKEGGYDYED